MTICLAVPLGVKRDGSDTCGRFRDRSVSARSFVASTGEPSLEVADLPLLGAAGRWDGFGAHDAVPPSGFKLRLRAANFLFDRTE